MAVDNGAQNSERSARARSAFVRIIFETIPVSALVAGPIWVVCLALLYAPLHVSVLGGEAESARAAIMQLHQRTIVTNNIFVQRGLIESLLGFTGLIFVFVIVGGSFCVAGTLILRFGAWAAMQSGLPRILHPLPMTLLPLALLMTTPIMLHNLLTPTVLYQLCIIGFIPFYQRLSRTRTFEMVFWRVTLAQFLAILMMFGWTVLWFGR